MDIFDIITPGEVAFLIVLIAGLAFFIFKNLFGKKPRTEPESPKEEVTVRVPHEIQRKVDLRVNTWNRLKRKVGLHHTEKFEKGGIIVSIIEDEDLPTIKLSWVTPSILKSVELLRVEMDFQQISIICQETDHPHGKACNLSTDFKNVQHVLDVVERFVAETYEDAKRRGIEI